jgi:hypothetical protein
MINGEIVIQEVRRYKVEGFIFYLEPYTFNLSYLTLSLKNRNTTL